MNEKLLHRGSSKWTRPLFAFCCDGVPTNIRPRPSRPQCNIPPSSWRLERSLSTGSNVSVDRRARFSLATNSRAESVLRANRARAESDASSKQSKAVVANVGNDLEEVPLEGDTEEDEEEDAYPEPEHIKIVDNFLSDDLASKLRGEFEDIYRNPRESSLNPKRFIWDYWYVPGTQYHLLRTMASKLFSDEIYEALEYELLKFARVELSCDAMTPVFCSMYMNGHEQRIHCDIPHGPFAFVLSLSKTSLIAGNKKQLPFEGGETKILRPHVLDFWRSFDSSSVVEQDEIFETVPPHFNRLVVFDPRLPHYVSQVRGPQDPRDSRLVIHGWFAEPAPFADNVDKGFDDAFQEALEGLTNAIVDRLQELPMALGMIALRIEINKETQRAQNIVKKVDTLIPHPRGVEVDQDPSEVREMIWNQVIEVVQDFKFPKLQGSTRSKAKAKKGGAVLEPSSNENVVVLTLPFVFE